MRCCSIHPYGIKNLGERCFAALPGRLSEGGQVILFIERQFAPRQLPA